MADVTDKKWFSVKEEVPEGQCEVTTDYPESPLLPENVPCQREVWEGADRNRCIWHADAPNKPVEELADARGEDGERLDGAILGEADLGNAMSFADCTLQEAVLRDADLQDADLQNANLWKADLTDANLAGANLTDAAFQDADLTDAAFQDADLTDADLAGANLRDVNLREADLTDADLIGADLTNAILWEADLTDADLQVADLSATDLPGTDLIRANLAGADLTDCFLPEATLTKAILERANLTRVDLFDADLRGARLYGAVLADVQFNTGTQFDDYYPDDVDKAAWTLAQIEDLARQNAQPDQVRDAFVKRKDRRRRHYWHNSVIPGWIRGPVHRLKAGGRALKSRFHDGLREFVNDDAGIAPDTGAEEEASEGTVEDENSETPTDESGDAEAPDVDNEPTASEASDDAELDEDRPTNWERLVNTARWSWAAFTGLLMRYGESWRRVVGVSLLTILGFALLYPFFGGVMDGGEVYQLESVAAVASPEGLDVLLRSLYFSTITFTTIGYANVAPIGAGSRLLVGLESFAGALLMAMLVFVLGRRSTR